MERLTLLSHGLLATVIGLGRISGHGPFAPGTYHPVMIGSAIATTPEPATWMVAASLVVGFFVLRAAKRAIGKI